MTTADGKFGDLGVRLASAFGMILVGGGALWLGGGALMLLLIACGGLMAWEVSRLAGVAPRWQWAIGVLGAGAVMNALLVPALWGWLTLAAPIALLTAQATRLRAQTGVYLLAVLAACVLLAVLRGQAGLAALLWLVAVVIASDVAGYFAGRLIGGPKFWPAVSPKKTWSGTVAGWLGAAAVGAGFVWAGLAGWALVLLSVPVALAGQMGDLAESWLKRRAGVKDSSALIPGHGGLLDRFDALVFAALIAALILPLGVLPEAAVELTGR